MTDVFETTNCACTVNIM